jgi:HlyD family secretion protein
MRRWVVRIAVVLGLVLVGVLLRATVFAPDPLEVEVAEVARGRVEETVTNSRAGTVKARRRAQISPEIGGRVVAIPFREGERFEQGDVLLRLDPDVPEAQIALRRREIQTARAEAERACLAAERAERERQRLDRLAREGIISEDLRDQAQTGAETARAGCRAARATVEQAEAALEVSRRQFGQTVIRAPFSGLVADVSAEVGEYTTPSPPGLPIPPILDVIDPRSIYVSAPMDEVDSARIREGQPTRISVDPYPDRAFPGVVRRVAPYVLDVEEQNRTVEIDVDFEGLPEAVRLLPGTSADVEVILEAHADVLRVPTSALLEGNRVLVVEDGVLRERQLEIGIRNWDWTEVLSGLSPGDEIVTSLDRPEIEAGAEVEVVRDREAGEP